MANPTNVEIKAAIKAIEGGRDAAKLLSEMLRERPDGEYLAECARLLYLDLETHLREMKRRARI